LSLLSSRLAGAHADDADGFFTERDKDRRSGASNAFADAAPSVLLLHLCNPGQVWPMRIEFDWDPAKSASNVAKHGVAFNGAMTVFRDPLSRSMLDPDSVDERVFERSGYRFA
jgi:hypothetical protein